MQEEPEYANMQMLCRQEADNRKQPGGKTVRLFYRITLF